MQLLGIKYILNYAMVIIIKYESFPQYEWNPLLLCLNVMMFV